MKELSREEINAIMKKQGLVYGWWKDNMKGIDKMKCLENAAHIDEYINDVMKKCTEQTEVLILCEMAKGYLEDLRPHGEWKYNPDCVNDEMQAEFYCSICNQGAYSRHDNFCPNCGADMRKEGQRFADGFCEGLQSMKEGDEKCD